MVSAGHGQTFSVIDGFGREEERGSLATTRRLDFSWGDFGEIHLFFLFSRRKPAGSARKTPRFYRSFQSKKEIFAVIRRLRGDTRRANRQV